MSHEAPRTGGFAAEIAADIQVSYSFVLLSVACLVVLYHVERAICFLLSFAGESPEHRICLLYTSDAADE